MTKHDLSSNDGLRTAIESLGSPGQWGETASEWMRRLAETIQWVRNADEQERTKREFQERLWEHNHVAAIGQGNISVERRSTTRDSGIGWRPDRCSRCQRTEMRDFGF